MIFNQYDRVRIVNLPERVDRRRDMERELARLGFAADGKIKFHPATRVQDAAPFARVGSHGNFLSQLSILEEALAAEESVMILEDDCFFLPLAAEYEQPAGTDIFYGGWTKIGDEPLHDADLMASHCMGFSAGAVRQLVPFLRKLLDPKFEPDPAIVRSAFDPNIRPPIDGAYVWFRRYHPDLETAFAMITDQRPSASDVATRRWFDKLPVLASLAGHARRIKHQAEAEKRWSGRAPVEPAELRR